MFGSRRAVCRRGRTPPCASLPPKAVEVGSVGINSYLALVCGLNIRDLNRITLDEQLALLNAVSNQMSVTAVQDKGSYLVRTGLEPVEVVAKILDALRSRCPSIKGVGVASPSVVKNALDELTSKLQRLYEGNFSHTDFGLSLADGKWRAGLAFPIFPQTCPDFKLSDHRTKNAMFFGLTKGAALVAKREVKNIHWGSVVNDPVERILKRQGGLAINLTSRSANIIRELVKQSETRRV